MFKNKHNPSDRAQSAPGAVPALLPEGSRPWSC